MSDENLLFFALIPFRDLRKEITRHKENIAAKFGSSKALNVVPHITVKTPFKCNNNFTIHLWAQCFLNPSLT